MSLIINELLCYLLAKIDSVPIDTLTRLVNENFSDSDVDSAKSLLCQHVDESIRAGAKRGQHKKKHDLDDVMKMLVQCDRSTLPRFVALDLGKLPPISIDCIDVSSLMRKQQLQDVEIANLKDLVQEVLIVTAETSKKLEVSLLPNHRRPSYGAALSTASGPDDTSASSAPSASAPVPVTPEPAPESAPGPSYADVVRDATADPESSEWSVANRRTRARAPGPRKPADPATSGSDRSTGPRQVRSTGNRAVIGSRKTGPIRSYRTLGLAC